MKKNIWTGLSLTACMLVLYSCASVPLTNRRQLDIIPGSKMLATSFQQYDAFIKANKLSTNAQQTRMVKTVGLKIQKAVEQYMAENGMSSRLENYQWEFNLVESPDINAWCMSGGKVVVYTGLLPLAKDENGLAVVMGHEIAHAIAKHGEERMSQALLVQLSGVSLSAALNKKPEETQKIWMAAFGAGSQFGLLLPFSRLHESEADRLGLIFMAMAGYDPGKAVDFWQRMAQTKQGGSPPEFLSTHPSDQKRIDQIKNLLPEATEYYRRSN